MTATDSRWWAPAAPGIGPDETDLQLLTPGTDAALDLGQAFLALHRVGAAACEAVATQPVADESTLAFALATARQEVAPEASTIVSKAVGDDTNYANLLIRDLLDDAESSALSLWRSCMAAKVPAPMAAQRVGMVYGVPPSEILPYQRLATEVRTPPVALVDAADRALFSYVSKLVKEEAQERKVEISKMTLEEWNRSQEGAKHPKDQVGRFARVAERAPVSIAGMSAQDWLNQQMAPTTEVDEPVQQRAPKVPKRPKRPVAPKAKVGSKISYTLSSTLSSQLHSARQDSRLASLLDEIPPNPEIERAYNKARQQNRELGDVNKPYSPSGDTASAQWVEHELAFVMPTDEWMQFNKKARAGEDGKEFRAGRLQDYIGDPEIFTDDDEQEGVEHQRNIAHVVDILRADPATASQPAEVVEKLDGARVLAADNPEAVLDEMKATFLAKQGLTPAQIRNEIGFVRHAADFDDPSQVALVYLPPPAGPDKLMRIAPAITEVVVRNEDLKGYNDAPPGSEHQWRLEKNQTLAFLTSAFAGPDSRKLFWDNNKRVFRTRVYARRVDDDFGKAMTPDRFHELEGKGVYVRDEDGEFTATKATIAHVLEQLKESQMTAVQAPKRPKVPKRPRAVPSRVQSGQLGSKLSSGLSSQVGSAVGTKIRRQADPTAFSLADEPHTAVPPGVHFGHSFGNRVQPTEKQMQAIERAKEGGMISTEDNIAAMHVDVHRIWDNKHTREVNTFEDVTVEELEDIADAIHAAMEQDDNFTLAKVHLQLVDDERANITVLRNVSVFGPRDVIRWGPTNKYTQYSLVPERSGRFQTMATIRSWLHNAWDSAQASGKETGHYVDDDYIANPWVRVWRAEEG